MGQYKLSIYYKLQFGLLFKYEDELLEINLPFVSVFISTSKHSKNYLIFNKFYK